MTSPNGLRIFFGKTHPEKTHGNRRGFCLEVFNGFAFFIYLLFLSFVLCFLFFALFLFFIFSFFIFPTFLDFSCFSFFICVFLFFLFFSFSLFSHFFFFFSVVRVDAKTGKIFVGEVPTVKMTISFCENSIFGPRWTGKEVRNSPLERDAAFMFFIFLLSCFPFLFVLRKMFLVFFFLYLSQTCFIAGMSIRV